MIDKIEWYMLSSLHGIVVYRAKVPGGWLVFVYQDNSSGLTFYPDPQHLWDGNSLP